MKAELCRDLLTQVRLLFLKYETAICDVMALSTPVIFVRIRFYFELSPSPSIQPVTNHVCHRITTSVVCVPRLCRVVTRRPKR